MQKVNTIISSIAQKPRPIIKWTGGKYAEFPMFAQYIPAFNNYCEPFFGGGGVFFALRPKAISFINDKSADLINFYRSIQSKEFEAELFLYADAWDKAGELSSFLTDVLIQPFKSFVEDKISNDKILNILLQFIGGINTKKFYPLFDHNFILSESAFKRALSDSLADKFSRIKKICIKEDRVFNQDELTDHIETGVKSGLYLYLRELMNDHASGRILISTTKATANWYFVREFCYASMFRYNSKGEFNIPYGGIAYNRKNFRQKTENIFSESIRKMFRNTKIYNLDFQQFIETINPQPNDFIFVDPPYDSNFSKYDNNAFSQNDQQRLRDVLFSMKAKWMLVIKGTKFIRSLYSHPGCSIIEFDKTYTYNVRGRNNRDAQHLIIVNYGIGK